MLAIEEAFKIAKKFPPTIVEAVFDDIKFGGDAIWPTAGELNVLLLEKQNGLRATPKDPPQARPKHSDNRLLATPAGREARRRGFSTRFLLDVADGVLRDDEPLPTWWVEKAIEARTERRRISKLIDDPTSEFYVPDLEMRKMLESMSRTLDLG